MVFKKAVEMALLLWFRWNNIWTNKDKLFFFMLSYTEALALCNLKMLYSSLRICSVILTEFEALSPSISFVVMWIKEHSVSKSELPIDLKTSITVEVSNQKVFSNTSVSSWCNWCIPSLTSPNLRLISFKNFYIIGPGTVHFNNAFSLSKSPMAPPFVFINSLFCSIYCLICSIVRGYSFGYFHCKTIFRRKKMEGLENLW